jgi:integrase/recombinase XerC/integrase/recombinase XerD
VALIALRSAVKYWADQGWVTSDPVRSLRRRSPARTVPRALSRADVERLLTCDDIAIRERTLWRMLYETAARSAEVLAMDVEDLDLPSRRAKVRRKAARSTSSCGRPAPPGCCRGC